MTATEELKDKYFDNNFDYHFGNSYRELDLARGEYRAGTGASEEAKKVIGSLRRNAEAWVELGANKFILDIVKTGYKIPFLQTPDPANFRNNRSALNERDFVDEAISELLQIGGILETKVLPRVVNPLTVAVKNGKKRLVLDLRYVNGHVWREYGKFEEFREFRGYIERGSYMFGFDLKSGYHHIDIFEEHWKYLGFAWTGKDGVKKYYIFVVLPFGLCTAGYVFTKVCRVLVKFWRRHGVKIVLYIDDGLGAAESLKACAKASSFVRLSLLKAGFVANSEKSQWDPVQLMVWLGWEINTREFVIRVKEKRIEKLISGIERIKSAGEASARQVSSVAGQIVSTDLVLGPVTGMFTREMYVFIEGRSTWDGKAQIPEMVACECKFWLDNIKALNLKRLHESGAPVSAKVNSDASSVAGGAAKIGIGVSFADVPCDGAGYLYSIV